MSFTSHHCSNVGQITSIVTSAGRVSVLLSQTLFGRLMILDRKYSMLYSNVNHNLLLRKFDFQRTNILFWKLIFTVNISAILTENLMISTIVNKKNRIVFVVFIEYSVIYTSINREKGEAKNKLVGRNKSTKILFEIWGNERRQNEIIRKMICLLEFPIECFIYRIETGKIFLLSPQGVYCKFNALCNCRHHRLTSFLRVIE